MAGTTVDLQWHRAHRTPGTQQVDAARLREVAGCFSTGVTVVSTVHGQVSRGMTANAFASVSLDPMLVLVCVRRDSEMRRLLDSSHRFAVCVLAADQRDVAAWFADPARPPGRAQFDRVGWWPGRATGSPLIRGSLAWLECAVAQRVGAGDHQVLIGRVLDLGRGEPAEPLVFFDGGFATAGPLPDAAAASVVG